jgi:ketosteroid isomerase-like protein
MSLTSIQEEEVIKTMEQYTRAYQNKDIESFSAIFSPEISGFGSGPDEVIKNHQDLIQNITRDMNQATILSVAFSDRKIFGDGAIAWVTSQTTMTFTIDGTTKQTLHGRSTMVLRNTGSDYIIEQLHFSLPCKEQSEGQSFPRK